ncbi:hypothetical protein KEM55_005399, partial [Ascosphaera atra]
ILRSSRVEEGYHVGQVERVEDISTIEEEALEATETGQGIYRADIGQLPDAYDRKPTMELFRLSKEYVDENRWNGAWWLGQRVIDIFGPPPSSPALFPYWFASVVPLSDEQRYALLQARSVRERLKITARWAKALQQKDWYVLLLNYACTQGHGNY